MCIRDRCVCVCVYVCVRVCVCDPYFLRVRLDVTNMCVWFFFLLFFFKHIVVGRVINRFQLFNPFIPAINERHFYKYIGE